MPSVTQELRPYLENEDPLIAHFATEARKLRQDFNQNKITKSEFNELLGDLFDLRQIDELAESIERKANIEKAIRAIAKLVGMVF